MEKIIVDISWANNYGAASDDILGCVVAHETFEGIKEAYASALEFHLEGITINGEELPEKVKGEYELVFKLDVHALLHNFNGILTRSALAKITGINEKQLGHYAQGIKEPRKKQRDKIITGIHKIGQDFLNVV